MNLSAVVVLGLAVIVALIMLESRRQVKKYGKGSGTGASLARAGLMEVQNLLEPERKIEVIRDAERKEDLLVELTEGSAPRPTAPWPAPGARPPRGSPSRKA